MESTDRIIQESKVDTSETWLWEAYHDAFRKLLIDHSTKKNIIWATDSYEEFGELLADEAPRFKECDACKTGQGLHNGIPVKIRDWKAYHNSANNKNTGVTDVLFRSLINTRR